MLKVISLCIFCFIVSCSEQKDKIKSARDFITDLSQKTLSPDSIGFDCDYLGEIPPDNDPKIFCPHVISTGDLHSSVYFPPDGKEVYYTRLSSNGTNSGLLCRKKLIINGQKR